MRSRVMPLVLIAFAAACAPSVPVGRPSPEAEVPPVRTLLSERERLSLSSDQVLALDSISRELDVADRAVGGRLGIIKGRLAPRLSLGKPRSGMSDLAARQIQAIRAVEQLLSAEQRTRLCELAKARMGKVALRDDKRAVTGSRLASSSRREMRTGWPWCSPARPSVAQSGS